MRIAIMDRNHEVAYALKEELERRQVSAIVVQSYSVALRLLKGRPRPAALFVGEFVGDRPGVDLLAEIERTPGVVDLPVFTMLSHPRSLIASALRSGGVHVLVPPLLVVEIAEVIATALEARSWTSAQVAQSDDDDELRDHGVLT